jgi:hypothetical protein
MWPIVALIAVGMAAMVAAGFIPADNPIAGRISVIATTIVSTLIAVIAAKYGFAKKDDPPAEDDEESDEEQ